MSKSDNILKSRHKVKVDKNRREYHANGGISLDIRDLLWITSMKSGAPMASLFCLGYASLFSKEEPVVNEVKEEANRYFKREYNSRVREITGVTSTDSIPSLMENYPITLDIEGAIRSAVTNEEGRENYLVLTNKGCVHVTKARKRGKKIVSEKKIFKVYTSILDVFKKAEERKYRLDTLVSGYRS